jgi:hypothetical protein
MSDSELTPERGAMRRTTETKAAYKTTEFYAFIVAVLAVLIAADNIGGSLARDYFRADEAWLYVTILTVGYMISRGLAKAGSREPYTDVPTRAGDGAPLSERVKTAAAVLKDGDEATSGPEPRAPESRPVSR